MLNQSLADAFRKTNAGHLTGALKVVHGERALRFFFEAGELLLLDFCADKELLLARQFTVYHKIGPEIEMVLTQQWQSQGIRVQDYLMDQQLVTAEEIGQVTRTLVEDAFCAIVSAIRTTTSPGKRRPQLRASTLSALRSNCASR